VDPLRAACFQLRHLLLALEAGEPARICAGLAAFGAMQVAQGTPSALKKGGALIDRGEAIARRLGTPRETAATSIQAAIRLLITGDWAPALERFDGAVRLLQERCRGVAGDVGLARTGAMMALDAMGRIGEIAARATVWLREATELGNLFARIGASLNLAVARIAAGDVEGARALVRQTMTSWSQRGFHVQHLYALRLEAYGDLHEGRPHTAHARVVDAWRAVEASQLLRVQFGRIDMRLLRARVSIASAAARWSGKVPLLAQAEEDAAALAREIRHDAGAAAALIRACAAEVRGEHGAALDLLDAAARGYEAAGMRVLAACAWRRWGQIAGGDEGRARVVEAEALMTEQGIAPVERWALLYTPGFRS
jgi:hypothetical protein